MMHKTEIALVQLPKEGREWSGLSLVLLVWVGLVRSTVRFFPICLKLSCSRFAHGQNHAYKRSPKRFKVPHAYVDCNELLANPEVDAVCVVTMWDQHVGPALAALRAGKHVFIEKPMASLGSGLCGDRSGGE